MKERDKPNSHISSKLHIIYITKYVLFYCKNTINSRGLCDHKTHCTFSLSVNISYQQRATATTTDTETLWPRASVGWRHLVCEKNC